MATVHSHQSNLNGHDILVCINQTWLGFQSLDLSLSIIFATDLAGNQAGAVAIVTTHITIIISARVWAVLCPTALQQEMCR